MKKKSEILMPGYKLYEYLLVLNPHEELKNRIKEIRADFNKEYSIVTPTGAKPNLALVRFEQLEMTEERIINKLKRIAQGYPPFKVDLKDFGSFPSHTIFINTLSKVPIQNLVKEIRSETQSLMKLTDDKKPYFIMEPHITIGRKLKPWQYEKGWLEFSNKHFTGRFIADEILLLKRLAGKRNWMVAKRFQFENMPIATKQGELFS